MRHKTFIIGLILSSLAGCGDAVTKAFPSDARWILAQPDTLELFSLQPGKGIDPTYNPKDPATFHGYHILGKVAIAAPSEQSDLINAAFDAVRQCNHGPAACFNPRHGLHATRAGKTVDIAICFECSGLQIFFGSGQTFVPIDSGPKTIFEAAVKRAGLPAESQPK